MFRRDRHPATGRSRYVLCGLPSIGQAGVLYSNVLRVIRARCQKTLHWDVNEWLFSGWYSPGLRLHCKRPALVITRGKNYRLTLVLMGTGLNPYARVDDVLRSPRPFTAAGPSAQLCCLLCGLLRQVAVCLT